MLVNSNSPGFYLGSRGLREDSFLLLLCLLIMQVLVKMFGSVVVGGRIKGFKMEGRNGEDMTISRLLFALNMIIFCEVDMENIRSFRCILLCFVLLGKTRKKKGKQKNENFSCVIECQPNSEKDM